MEDTQWLFFWYAQTMRATMRATLVVLKAYCYIVYEAYMEGPSVTYFN